MVSSARVHTERRGAAPVVQVMVAAGVIAAVTLGVVVSFRAAGYALAVLLLAVAAARALLPARLVGALVVRSPAVDALTVLALAAGLAVLARTAPG